MNNRGQEVMSLYWFLILVVIAGGIFAMVYIFYGTPFDVRELESNILINKVADCISYVGKINSNIIFEGKFANNSNNFLTNCHLIFNSEEWEEPQFYTEINFYKIGDLDNSLFSIKEGNNNLVPFCSINQKQSVECTNKMFYSVDELNNQYLIKILTVVKKSEKNVKL
jgi:hypothetical protein